MSFLLPFLIGTAAGVLASWGVGGGTLLLIVLTLLLDVPQRTAQSINLLFFLPTAAAALLIHRRQGYLRKDLLRRLIPAGAVFAAGAAFLAPHLDTALLRRPFGILLLFAAGSLLRQTRASQKNTPDMPSA